MTHANEDQQRPLRDEKVQHVFSGLRRIVVKLGTNVLSRPDGELALGRVHAILEDLADLHRSGAEIILVSSGAISLGMDRLGLEERPRFLSDKQACAAIGQIRLMSTYQQAFERFSIATAQVLLTEDDFASRSRYLNLRSALSRLLELRVLPVVNENDTVSTSEIEARPRPGDSAGDRSPVFGDNDCLSALVASKLDADLLLILSDVSGLYATRPDAGSDAPPLSLVPEITAEVEAMAGMDPGGSKHGRGRGGMASKLAAIRIAQQSGVSTVIANGRAPRVIPRVLAGEELGTLFLARERMKSRKHWIGFASATAGRVRVNQGARDALLERGSSLLFAGILSVEGSFRRGDVLAIVDESGSEFARGIANCDTIEAERLAGTSTRELETLPVASAPEFIHRDNIALRG